MASSQEKNVEVSPTSSSSSVRANVFDRSPSVSSSKEDRWPELLVSKPERSYLFSTKRQDITKDSRIKVVELQSDEEEKRSIRSTSSDKGKHEKDSELQKALEEERRKSLELQKELDLQVSLKAEMEVAMKLLEKDIHDKQDTIISLRRQLDDIKLINLEMYKKLQLMNSNPMSGGGGFRRDDGGRGKRGGDGRRQGSNNFMDNNSTWKTSTSRNTYSSVDTNKLKAAANKKSLSGIKLAPQNSGWNHGSGTKNIAQAVASSPAPTTNKYSVLADNMGDPISFRVNKDVSSPSYAKGASIERYSFSSRADFSSGSGSRSGSMSLQRSTSSSRTPAASPPPEPPAAAPPAPLPAVPQEPLTEAQKKKINSFLRLCLINYDCDEMVTDVQQCFQQPSHSGIIMEILNVALELPAKDIAMVSKAVLTLVSSGTISPDNVILGFADIFEMVPDILIDVPMLYEILGKILSPLIEKKHISFAQILSNCGAISSANQSHLLLRALIKNIKDNMGPTFAKNKWLESGLQLSDWMKPDQVSKFIADNKFEFLEGETKPSEEVKNVLTPVEAQAKILQLMNSDENCECIRGWVQDNLGKSANEDWFMRSLIQAIYEHALFGPEGRDVPYFNQDRMNKYSGLINEFGETKEAIEANCLVGIQQLIHRLEHPQASGSGSRSGSMSLQRSTSSSRTPAASPPPEPPAAAPPAPLPAVPQEPLTEAQKKKINSFLRLCLINYDCDEMVTDVQQCFQQPSHSGIIMEILNVALELPAKDIAMVSKAVLTLVSSGTISPDNVILGFADIFEMGPDILIDVPMLYEILGKILSPLIEKKHISFAQILSNCGAISSANQSHLLLRALIKNIKDNMGPTFAKNKWLESGLQLSDWMKPDQVSKFIADNKFEFLEGETKPSEEVKNVLTPVEAQAKILQLMNSDENCECIRGWVQDNLGKSANEDWFMRSLIQAICEHALFGPEGRDVPYFNQDRMNKYSGLINEFGETKEAKEANCLVGIQQLIHRLEHPQGLTLEIFQYLHEQYLISVEGFIAWEASLEPGGKGVMLKALTSFFTNIKEADNEDSCSED